MPLHQDDPFDWYLENIFNCNLGANQMTDLEKGMTHAQDGLEYLQVMPMDSKDFRSRRRKMDEDGPCFWFITLIYIALLCYMVARCFE